MVAAVVAPCLTLLSGWQIWTSHEEALADAEATVTALARVAQEHVAGFMRGIDRTLDEVVDMVPPSGGADPRRFAALMASRMAGIGEIEAAVITDATGKVMLSTLPGMAGTDLHDRGFFVSLAQDPSRTLAIGEPLQSRVRSMTVMVFARPIRAADGGFRGIVALSVDPRIFDDELRTVTPLGGSAVLVRGDGMMLARAPDSVGWVGRSMADSSLFRRATVEPFGVQDVVSPVDGARRIAAFRAVKGYPLVTVVGLPRDVALDKWFGDAAIQGAATAILILLTFGLALVSDRSLAERQKAQAALAASEARFRLMSDRAPLGIFRTDGEGRCLYVNDRWLELVGWRGDRKSVV